MVYRVPDSNLWLVPAYGQEEARFYDMTPGCVVIADVEDPKQEALLDNYVKANKTQCFNFEEWADFIDSRLDIDLDKLPVVDLQSGVAPYAGQVTETRIFPTHPKVNPGKWGYYLVFLLTKRTGHGSLKYLDTRGAISFERKEEAEAFASYVEQGYLSVDVLHAHIQKIKAERAHTKKISWEKGVEDFLEKATPAEGNNTLSLTASDLAFLLSAFNSLTGKQKEQVLTTLNEKEISNG